MSTNIRIHESSLDYPLVIGVDFGTTRSGFVHCFLEHGADEISLSRVHHFDDWQICYDDIEMNIPSYAKNLTELFYESNGQVSWGWGAREKSLNTKGHLL